MQVDALGYVTDGIIHVTAYVGYVESPNVAGALRLLDSEQTEGAIDIDQASYLLSKLELTRGTAPTMAKWRKRLVVGAVLIVVGLEFFPALALGPLVEGVS